MKPTHCYSHALHVSVALLFAATLAEARDFGVSTSSAGRGTKVTTERGGTAYVGPRGAAAESAGGKKAASGVRGSAYSGENVKAASGRRGSAAVTESGNVYARRNPVAVTAHPTAAAPTTVVAAPLPAGYIRTIPAGYRTVVYGGYNCYLVGGVYYRPVFYGGSTVYVVVP